MGRATYGGDGPVIMGVVWAEFVVSCFMVLIRYFTNIKVVGEFGADFWWACATLFFGLVSQIFITIAVHYGLGNESSSLPPDASARAILWTWLGQSMCIFSIALSKLVVISFLLRVQSRTSRWGRYFLYFLAVTNVFINVFETILVMFQCSPTWKLWIPDTPGDCYVRDHVNSISGYLQGAWNAASDVCLAIYPAIMFYNVQMPLRLKIGVSLLMATGLFAAACAAGKTWEIRDTHVLEDVTVALTALTLLNWSELWVTLIAASIPAVWPLVGYMRHGRRDAYMRQRNPSTYGRSRSRGSVGQVGDDDGRSDSPSAGVALEGGLAGAHVGKDRPGFRMSTHTDDDDDSRDEYGFGQGSLEYTERAETPSIHERTHEPTSTWNSRSSKGSAVATVEPGQAV